MKKGKRKNFGRKRGNIHIFEGRAVRRQEIIGKIKTIYQQRKEFEGDTLQTLAEEIGISVTRLHDSISGKFTSGKTLKLFQNYLQKLNLVTPGAQK